MENTSFKLWYSGIVANKNGVGILIDKTLKDGKVGLSESEKWKFWEDLCGMVRAVPTNEKFFIGEDLNGHVGSTNVGYERTHGGFRERDFVEGAWSEEEEDANNMWVKMATCIRKVASEVFGVTKGSSGESKDTWWWTEDFQKAIKEKKECYRNVVNIERYKVAKKTAKRVVSEAKGRAYDDLYRRLSTKEGEKDVYKIARIQERKTRDLNQVKCVKDEMDQLLVKGQDIKQRW
ncbi:hypothetical protein Zm00014a_026464 [Zea mays]|uniref:Uncharacterized protein n=1 Tax=Zea mays TaxID=4577 RepID=A0A3L6FK42_MAIZE|nr:hypothetical protein Zm00014a_026464 [Zea mays]